MSILQEALRRKEAEQSGAFPSSGLHPFPQPPPPTAAPPPPPPRKQKSGLPVLVMVLGLGILLLGGLSLAGYLLYKSWTQTTATKAQWPANVTMTYRTTAPHAAAPLTIYEFWATWCPPCRESIPHLNKLYAQYGGRGLEIVGITDEDRATVDAFLRTVPAGYPIAFAGDRALATRMGVKTIPTAFAVTADGRILWHGHPMTLPVELLEKELPAAATVPGPATIPAPTPDPAPTVSPVIPQPTPPSPAPVVTPAPAPVPAPPAIPTPAPRRPVTWPDLTVRGVVATGGEMTAVVNSDILRAGDEIRGARIVKISEDAVTFEFQGDTRILRIGQTTQPR